MAKKVVTYEGIKQREKRGTTVIMIIVIAFAGIVAYQAARTGAIGIALGAILASIVLALVWKLLVYLRKG